MALSVKKLMILGYDRNINRHFYSSKIILLINIRVDYPISSINLEINWEIYFASINSLIFFVLSIIISSYIIPLFSSEIS